MFGLLTKILLTKKKGPLFSSWRWNKQNSPAAHLHVEQRRQQLQKSIICFLVGSPYYHSSFSALSRWLPANTLHPQRPPLQRFVNFWQLFFLLFFFFVRAHVGAPAPYPSTTLSLENDLPWCYGCRSMQNTSPDTSTSFSPRDILLPGRKEEKEALNHEWKPVSHPFILIWHCGY